MLAAVAYAAPASIALATCALETFDRHVSAPSAALRHLGPPAASHLTVPTSSRMPAAFRAPGALPQFPREPLVAVHPSASDRALSLVLPRIRRSPCDTRSAAMKRGGLGNVE